MEQEEEVVAAEFKINLLRPAVGPRIVAEAHVVRAGRTLVISEVTVSASVDEQPVRVAMMVQTNCRVRKV
jgi:acyl-coenzyme A thioesterase PaaI-like protein